MSTQATPPPSSDPPKAEEISLEDIDKILEQEDPEFTKSLEEVRAVEADTSVTIEASVPDDSATPDLALEPKPEKAWRRGLARLRARQAAVKIRIRHGLAVLARETLIFLKTRPKEFALFSIVMLKTGAKQLGVALGTFREAPRARKLTFLGLIAMIAVSLWVLLHNFRGVWLPQINESILRGFTPGADWVEQYNPKEEGESFYSAFPQERHEFLFRKMKLNLRRTPENPLPMGAFEIIVLLDSKDTAIEVRDREVEFNDQLQRVFEEESFADLESELGKNRLKGRLKREMNQSLTQGWVKDISFKTFILKP